MCRVVLFIVLVVENLKIKFRVSNYCADTINKIVTTKSISCCFGHESIAPKYHNKNSQTRDMN